jgi:GNAT superfamily N-acetyltransferase
VTTISDALRSFAEEPDREMCEPPLPTRRIVRPTFTMLLSPTPSQSSVSCVRTTAEGLDATIADAREIGREAGYTGTVWQVGPSSRPDGLPHLLAARGFVPATRSPYESTMTVMALSAPPPPAETPGIEARLVASLDEYVLAMRVAMEAFNETEEEAAGWLAAAPALWASQDGVYRFTHIAYLDGRAVGFGFALSGPPGVLLGGSGVLPAARGRGVYRALLAARWSEALRLGRPGLVVQAGAMSRPILERCGFQAICQIEMLDDVGFMKT